MSSIRQIPSGLWSVEVRKKGFPPMRATRKTHAEAEEWGTRIEAAIYDGTLAQALKEENTPTVYSLFDQYTKEVTVKKKGAISEAQRITAMMETDLAALRINSVKPSHITAYRDTRLRHVKPDTVNRELGILSAFFSWCIKDLHHEIAHPVKAISRPKGGGRRDRRVMTIDHPKTGAPWSEIEAISEATGSAQLAAFVAIAVETAMRRGEIAAFSRDDLKISTENGITFGVLQLRDTKNGEDRKVPIQPASAAIIAKHIKTLPAATDRVFTLDPHSYSTAFRRARQRARGNYERLCADNGITPDPSFLIGLRLHDGRHEAISTLAERGDLSVQDISAIAGHLDYKSAERYTNLQAGKLARKLSTAKIKYPSVIKRLKTGFKVHLPDFPGVYLVADTLALAQTMARGIVLAIPATSRPAASSEGIIAQQYPKDQIILISEA